MKRILTLLAMALAIPLASPVLADCGRDHSDKANPMIEALSLSDEQAEAVEKVFADHHEGMNAHKDSLNALHEELKTQMDSETPDATRIGQIMLEKKALKAEMEEGHGALKGQLKELLDEGQMEKLEAMHGAKNVHREHGDHHAKKSSHSHGEKGSSEECSKNAQQKEKCAQCKKGEGPCEKCANKAATKKACPDCKKGESPCAKCAKKAEQKEKCAQCKKGEGPCEKCAKKATMKKACPDCKKGEAPCAKCAKKSEEKENTDS